jgi:hypothetical protein
MRYSADPKKPHVICKVKLSKSRTLYESKCLLLAEMRRVGSRELRKRFPSPTFFG